MHRQFLSLAAYQVHTFPTHYLCLCTSVPVKKKLFSAVVHLAKMTHCSNVIPQINLDISVSVSLPTEND